MVEFLISRAETFFISNSSFGICTIPAAENPFKGNLTALPRPGGGEFGKFYSLPSLKDPRIGNLLDFYLSSVEGLVSQS